MGGRLIILSTEFIQEIVFASVLWGAYTVLVAFTAHASLTRGFPQWSARILLAVVVALYVSTTVYWASALRFVREAIEIAEGEGTIEQDSITSFGCALTAPLLVNILLSDGVVWWRAWVLSGRKRSVLLFAGILLLATFVMSVLSTRNSCSLTHARELSYITVDLFSNDAFGVAATALSLFTNASATAAIGVQAWRFRKLLGSHLNTLSGRVRAEEILHLLIESSLVYCVLWSIILVGQAFSVVPLDAPFYKAYHDTPAGERFSDLYNFLLDGLVPIIVRDIPDARDHARVGEEVALGDRDVPRGGGHAAYYDPLPDVDDDDGHDGGGDTK
ncbi:hypothetical protein ONZ51_g1631 [Trametes cubensis]|uniref:Uncharacterized protein n=1 Tax=Trametes cubensis TaxID=1111947 RepID=A0AAD7XF98_9APHY|nr:hypothetical protein ONZ51_g1631 [Trametes cubensis]